MYKKIKDKLKKYPLITGLYEIYKQRFLSFYKNIYKTNYSRHLLISYITSPLRKGIIKRHSNYLELSIILETFKSFKFNIDFADYTYKGKINYKKYDLIFGFGYPFGKALRVKDAKSAIKICYETGSLKLFI